MNCRKYYRTFRKFVDHDLTNNKSLIQFQSCCLQHPSFYSSLMVVLVGYCCRHIRTSKLQVKVLADSRVRQQGRILQLEGMFLYSRTSQITNQSQMLSLRPKSSLTFASKQILRVVLVNLQVHFLDILHVMRIALKFLGFFYLQI